MVVSYCNSMEEDFLIFIVYEYVLIKLIVFIKGLSLDL